MRVVGLCCGRRIPDRSINTMAWSTPPEAETTPGRASASWGEWSTLPTKAAEMGLGLGPDGHRTYPNIFLTLGLPWWRGSGI